MKSLFRAISGCFLGGVHRFLGLPTTEPILFDEARREAKDVRANDAGVISPAFSDRG